MKTLEAIKRKLESARDLQSVVKTMKAMAAVSIRQYEEAVNSLQEYNRTLEMAFRIALRDIKPDFLLAEQKNAHRLGAIIFGSEQGMCGQFNEQIASFTLDHMAKIQHDPQYRKVVSLGIRPVAHLQSAGQTVEDTFKLPGSVQEITWSVHDLLLKIKAWRHEEKIDRIVLYYNKKRTGSSYIPVSWHLLPMDSAWLYQLRNRPWQSNSLPTYRMRWDDLLSALVRHYFFFHLFRAFAESLASENASRLAAMQAAEKNIVERLENLTDRYNRQRQSAITSELLDIVSGFEALQTKK